MERKQEKKLKPTELGKLVEEVELMHKLKPQRVKDLCEVAKDPITKVYTQMLGLSSKLDSHIKEELSMYKLSDLAKKSDSSSYESSTSLMQKRSIHLSYFSK